MVFSIPPQINPNYVIPDSNPVGHTLNIGTAIKDMPDGTDTPMRIEYNTKVHRAHEKYTNDQIEYDREFSRLTEVARTAETTIHDARKKKMIAVTALVTTIFATVAIGIASAVTGTWPLAFAVVPFLIGMVPASYYTHVFRKSVSRLESDIQAPSILRRPVLSLPTYSPHTDLDLKQTRIDFQNRIAGMSLAMLAQARYNETDVVRYALLDKVTVIAPSKRPAFYAKCLQLIQAHGELYKEQQKCIRMTGQSYSSLKSDLHRWKSEQDRSIRIEEENLRHREEAETRTECRISEQPPYHTVVKTVQTISIAVARHNLDTRKRELERTFGRREADLDNWQSNMNQSIENGLKAALNQLEQQYTLAKSSAS